MRFSESRIEKLLCNDGKKRSIHIWEPEAPTMVFLTVHGGMDHGGNYGLPALYFKEHGIATVALDQQGHDHHGPDHPTKVIISRFKVFLDDLDLMVSWVKENYPALPIYILAHSMGGLIVTHYGIERLDEDPLIRGFIVSSPYYVNAIKTPAIMMKLAGVLSVLAPKMTVPIEDLLPNVTRDQAIYERHRKDEADGIMATHASARFAGELLKAQAWVPGNIARWKHPILIIVAGADKVADSASTRSLVSLIKPGLVTELYYPENYHENFNELNRNEIFAKIVEWVNH
ncbi:MAG: alpha/beta fold hydrolase [Bacteroidales bacterium]